MTGMPVEQVLACDRGHGGVFCQARVRAVLSVTENRGLAPGNLAEIVVAPGDSGSDRVFGQIDLFLAELRIFQNVVEDVKDKIEVA